MSKSNTFLYKVIALVGPSGSGKTTLVDLLERFYDPTSGSVELDGVDIRRYDIAQYRSLFALVSQDVVLFNATLFDNITLGYPATEEEVMRAVRVAHIEDFVESLEDGLQHRLSDRGPLKKDNAFTFAVEYLPGQFDQRADSAEQCIAILSPGAKPVCKSAKIYKLFGNITLSELAAIKKYVINPVEAREASLAEYKTLAVKAEIPEAVKTISGFTDMKDEDLPAFLAEYSLAMDADDLAFCRDYFASEKRDPTITEIRMIDTYWSDHCRHTTFLTEIDAAKIEDPEINFAWEADR